MGSLKIFLLLGRTLPPYDRSECRCGIPNRALLGPRIVNGMETEVNEYPWQAQTFYFGMRRKWKQMCGGSLISDSWVLSAAHCVVRHPDPRFHIILLGDHDLSRSDETNHVWYRVLRIILHPNYSRKYQNFDVTLMQLSRKVNFSKYPHIRPICLPLHDRDDYAGRIATATGWGLTSGEGQFSKKLLEINLKVLSTAECSKYDEYWVHQQITYDKFCAHGNGGRTVCSGDSG